MRIIMQIYDMKVNHLTNPLGFRMTRTVFAWKVKNAEGGRQEAARLQEIMFDSGFDACADSLRYSVKLARLYINGLGLYKAFYQTGACNLVCESAVLLQRAVISSLSVAGGIWGQGQSDVCGC